MNKIISLLSALVLTTISAQASTLDSTHSDWKVYTDGKGVCYIASQPVKEDGNWKKRGQPYVLVNSKGTANEINVSSGYPYKSGTDVELKVDSRSFSLFSQNENAWAKTTNADAAILQWMQRGANLEVKGVSGRGSYSVDTYSLKGVTAAYKRMKELCK
jgi:invasion protein IalB